MTDLENALKNADIVIITVGTPMKLNGIVDVSSILNLSLEIKKYGSSRTTYVIKSTVPVGTSRSFQTTIFPKERNVLFNPEFLREGSAIEDFRQQSRIVIGTEILNNEHVQKLTNMYQEINVGRCPLIFTNLESAELIKYAANTFLALKISFINEMSDLCEEISANIDDVAKGIGLDNRIGSDFLKVGPGYGGSGFPKDVSVLLEIAQRHSQKLHIVEAVQKTNNMRPNKLLMKIKQKLKSLQKKTVAILGITYKANTNDIRESPSIKLIELLKNEGAIVRIYDPHCNISNLNYCEYVLSSSIEDAINNADAVVIMTEWNDFKECNWNAIGKNMRCKILFDFRNLLHEAQLKASEFEYYALGKNKTETN